MWPSPVGATRSVGAPAKERAADEQHGLQEPQPEEPAAPSRELDDGLWLLAGPVRRGAKAADLPDLDLRVRERATGQGLLRPHRRAAAAASGREGGARLLALQQPELRDPGGPASRGGRGGGRGPGGR